MKNNLLSLLIFSSTAVSTAFAGTSIQRFTDLQEAARDGVSVGQAPAGALVPGDHDLRRRNLAPRAWETLFSGEEMPLEAGFLPEGFLTTANTAVYVTGQDDTTKPLVQADDRFAPDRRQEGISFRLPGAADSETAFFLSDGFFAATGAGQEYGLGARLLGMNMGSIEPEIAPHVQAIWLQEPAAGDGGLRFFALVNSSAARGAYDITVTPGAATEVAVRGSLYVQDPDAKICLAPLTALFFEERPDTAQGALHPTARALTFELAATGEQESTPLVSERFSPVRELGTAPGPFGLLQDESTHGAAPNIPSALVFPGDEWPKGWTEHFQRPDKGKTNDNVWLYWVVDPAEYADGQRVDFEYTVVFGDLSAPTRTHSVQTAARLAARMGWR